MPSPVVFITGASSGLGAALARRHALLGHRVVLFARRDSSRLARELESPSGGAALAFRGDVTRRADLDRAVRGTLTRFGAIDIVYANAGYGERGRLEDLSLKAWRRQQAVNVEGLLNTVWAAEAALKASRGRLGLVGSVLGYGVSPANGAYAASKAAVRAISETLYLEWKAVGVSVTHIAPGFFESEFRHRDAAGRFDPSRPDTAPAGWRISAEVAAGYASRAVLARRREIVFPLHGKAAVFLYRFLPSLALFLSAWMRSKAKNTAKT